MCCDLPKSKATVGPTGEVITLPLDVFSVAYPEGYGAILAIRTGPVDWSRLAVIRLRQLRRRMDDGLVWGAGGGVWPCPEEVDFFRACGLPWVEPRDRR